MITRLSKKGDSVPVKINPSLVEELTATTARKHSIGMIVSRIIHSMPKIAAKIISVALTSMGRGSDLKLDMLEAIQNVSNT